MDKIINEWVLRKTLDGDVYYDRNSGIALRNPPGTMATGNLNYWSLPTFEVRAPLKVYFDFTYLCNLKCKHCITNSSPSIKRKSELPTERIKAIIRELVSIGVSEISIGGGEPLCHPDLFNILEHAHRLHINVVVTTNGTLLTPEIVRRFQELGIFEVHVSLDGSESVHDNIRGAGCYRKALESIIIPSLFTS